MPDSPSRQAKWDTEELAASDHRHCWHPFTPMAAWMDEEPLILTEGNGCWLTDSRGRRYLDANSSIWTNIHGHRHPRLVAALQEQAATLCHVSFLGTSNPWAIRLAESLSKLMPGMRRVFFTDDGSTAVESALKLAIQSRQQSGQPERRRFLAFEQAYHGDTMGASSLGGVSSFFERFRDFSFDPVRVSGMAELQALDASTIAELTAVVIEPLVQGVNRLHLWPSGMLADLRHWCDAHDVFLILDEVMTGFGRTGRMFACQHENVTPDFLCLAKGITGGTLPLAATLTTERIFEAFLEKDGEDRTFYYGHSYCGNPLGCAAALASLAIFEEDEVLASLAAKEKALKNALERIRSACPDHVGEIRQIGLIAGLDLTQKNGRPWPAELRMGARVCHAAREAGVLTRPVLDTLVAMPPLCITAEEIDHLADGFIHGIRTITEMLKTCE